MVNELIDFASEEFRILRTVEIGGLPQSSKCDASELVFKIYVNQNVQLPKST